MNSFLLNKRLKEDTCFICSFSLSEVLLMNDSRYPWIILVPRLKGVNEIFQLSNSNQHQLTDESSFICEKLKTIFNADKINTGALGNIVPQLHLHHIARYKNDDAWPGPVWGKHPPIRYTDEKKENIIQLLKAEFSGMRQL